VRHALLFISLFSFIALTVVPVVAQDSAIKDAYTTLPDQDLLYLLRGRNLDVKEALRFFARNIRVGFVLDETISGTIPADFPEGLSRVEYLDELALLFDFIWYFDGQVIRISRVGDLQMEVLALSENSGTAVIEVLQRLGIYQSKFTHRFEPRSRTLMIAGPASYTEAVKKAVEAIQNADRSEVIVLRGNESEIPSVLKALNSIDSQTPAMITPSATN
jgi:type III secretion protein C